MIAKYRASVIGLLHVMPCLMLTTYARENKVTSKTYFAVRPQFQVGSPEYTTLARHLHEDYENDGWHVCANATVFGGKSSDKCDLGSYFMPFGNASVSVDGTITDNGSALLPQHFNLFSVKYDTVFALALPGGAGNNVDTAFASTISFKPQQTVVGAGFSLCVSRLMCERYWFLKLIAPVVRVQNTMGFCESVSQEGEFYDVNPIDGQDTNLNKSLRTMKEAFAQDCWKYGKITCKDETKTRLAFIQALVGVELLQGDPCFIRSALGATIPTGNTPCSKVIFEPIVGHGAHAGVIWHNQAGMTIWECEDSFHVDVAIDTVSQYLFSKTHKRSMDLKGRPWSRYAEMYVDKAQAEQASGLADENEGFFLATPGINILTRDVEVKPGFNFTSNAALLLVRDFSSCAFNGEIGYNFFARESECIALKKCDLGTPALKDYTGRGIVSTVRDMTNDLLANKASANDAEPYDGAKTLAKYDARILTIDDLDLSSASHPCFISHTFYGSLGLRWEGECRSMLLGLGGSYEFSGHVNHALDRWLAWGTIGIGF